jgi:prepilin-type processing-associated H-X9-DG protein
LRDSGEDGLAMKKLSARRANEALTLIELLVAIAAMAIVLAMVLPMTRSHDGTQRTYCLSNLRQVDLGFLLYADDNNGKFPMQVPITNGGTMDYLYRNQTFPHFQKLAQYLRPTTVLHCPLDKERQYAASYDVLANTNISYFLNADVTTNHAAASILAGDRNLQANGKAVPPGLFVVTTNQDMSWTHRVHLKGGNLAFADGHAEFCKNADFNTAIARQPVTTNRLSVP